MPASCTGWTGHQRPDGGRRDRSGLSVTDRATGRPLDVAALPGVGRRIRRPAGTHRCADRAGSASHRTPDGGGAAGQTGRHRIAIRATSMLHGRPVTLIECALESGRTLVPDPCASGASACAAARRRAVRRTDDRYRPAGAARLAARVASPATNRPVGWRSSPPDDFRRLSEAAGVSLDVLLAAADPFQR